MWYLLATSLAALSFNRYLAYLILAATSFIGWKDKILELPALMLIVAIVAGGLFVGLRPVKNRVHNYWIEGVCVLVAIALVLHLFPGFNNPKVLNAVIVGPQSIPFSMYYNFDKALVPFVLLTGLSTLFVTTPVMKAGKFAWCGLVIAVPVLLMIAVMLGGLKVELHTPAWFAQFAIANIFFVSLAEEALFRGYLQQRLTQLVHPVAALLITSIAFGLMHYAGGVLLIVFASLSGIIYGMAWMWSGRLWVATLFHFGLNCIHLLCFTYPMLNPHALT
ncbi:CPBP family intramembrane metalloprotease [Cronobacter muytjensii]|nr:CPBP family intramembrane metalloprotease [Cronobacter muytjensii]